jgi:hypothetical protein
MKKAVWSNVGLAVAGLAVVSYLWFTPGRTPAIHEPNSIASLERIRLGGVDQYILIRGNDSSLPVVLFLHGGPGMPAMYLAHFFQRELEKPALEEWLNSGEMHRVETVDGSALICMNSLLARVQNTKAS